MVEWKKLWEVTIWDKKFIGVAKEMQPTIIRYHYYLANELAELERENGDIRILYTTDKVAYANSTDVKDFISEGEIVAIPGGGNVSIKYYKGKFVTADNRIATSNNIAVLNNKYLYYWMLSRKEHIGQMYRGAGIKHPSMLSVLSMQIPIPSIEEQNRIVGILDTLTFNIDNLKNQIKQRQKQYDFYRDQLLDLEGKEGVEWKKLGEMIISLKTGLNPRKNFVLNAPGSDIPYITGKDIYNNNINVTPQTDMINEQALDLINRRACLENNLLLFVSTGTGTVGRMAVIDQYNNNWGISETMYAIKTKDNLLPYFLMYCLYSSSIKKGFETKMTKGAVPHLKVADLKNVKIPILPLQKQQRIVSILDTFEESIANLESQLTERKKQYEYYRNQLLTFE